MKEVIETVEPFNEQKRYSYMEFLHRNGQVLTIRGNDLHEVWKRSVEFANKGTWPVTLQLVGSVG